MNRSEARRPYMAPRILNKENLQADQTIAACAKGKDQYKVRYEGWVCKWCGGAEQKTAYPSKAVALEAMIRDHNSSSPDGVFEAYGVYSGDRLVAYLEDYNHDGKLYPNGGGDNWQDVKDSRVYEGYFQS